MSPVTGHQFKHVGCLNRSPVTVGPELHGQDDSDVVTDTGFSRGVSGSGRSEARRKGRDDRGRHGLPGWLGTALYIYIYTSTLQQVTN